MGEDTGRTEFRVMGKPPPGRNGHTATLARRARRVEGEEDAGRVLVGGPEQLAGQLDGMVVSDAVQNDVIENLEDELGEISAERVWDLSIHHMYD